MKNLELRNLNRNQKLKLIKSLILDLGSQWINIKNLSGALQISEKKAKKCFRVFDRRLGLTIIPKFLKDPELEHIYLNQNLKEDPREILDLMTKVNIFVKNPDHIEDYQFNDIKSRFYSAKAWILWQLRDFTEEVALETKSTNEYTKQYYSITLSTGHQFHQPIKSIMTPKYWEKRVSKEKEFSGRQHENFGDKPLEYYEKMVDLLFYISRRGLDSKLGSERV